MPLGNLFGDPMALVWTRLVRESALQRTCFKEWLDVSTEGTSLVGDTQRADVVRAARGVESDVTKDCNLGGDSLVVG